MKLLPLLFYLSYFGQIFSQSNNIVPNPSFEFTTGCPNASAGWNFSTNWNNVNGNLGPGFWGTPDFFHPCGTGNTAPPNVFAGVCSPHTGVAMMALVVYNMGYAEYREYLSTPLACTMQPGTTYTLSFWLSNGTSHISPWTIRNMGVHFSNGPVTQAGFQPINVIPQCEISSNVISNGWTQFTFTVNPTSQWNYLTIGAFRTDANNNVTLSWPNPGGPASAYANYFVDDIDVLAPASGTTQILITSAPANPSICVGQSVALTASGANSYNWGNNVTTASVIVSPSVTTNYTVTGIQPGTCGTNTVSAMITINVGAAPSLTVYGNKKICRGESTTIMAFGAQSYSWNTGSTQASIIIAPVSNTTYVVSGITNLNCKTTQTVVIQVMECLRIESASEVNTTIIYPNPFSSYFIIEGIDISAQALDLRLFNSTGQVVIHSNKERPDRSFENGKIKLPAENLDRGIYLLEIIYAGKNQYFKIVKE